MTHWGKNSAAFFRETPVNNMFNKMEMGCFHCSLARRLHFRPVKGAGSEHISPWETPQAARISGMASLASRKSSFLGLGVTCEVGSSAFCYRIDDFFSVQVFPTFTALQGSETQNRLSWKKQGRLGGMSGFVPRRELALSRMALTAHTRAMNEKFSGWTVYQNMV